MKKSVNFQTHSNKCDLLRISPILRWTFRVINIINFNNNTLL